MTTYQTQDLFIEILEGAPIPMEKLEYFRVQFQLQIYDLIVSRFGQQETFTQADYARRIHRKPEVINRLLANPSNLTLDTVSDLLIGMGLLPVIRDERVIDRLRPAEDQHTSQILGYTPQREDLPPSQPPATMPRPTGDAQIESQNRNLSSLLR